MLLDVPLCQQASLNRHKRTRLTIRLVGERRRLKEAVVGEAVRDARRGRYCEILGDGIEEVLREEQSACLIKKGILYGQDAPSQS